MKTTIVPISSVIEHDRMDAEFHIAFEEFENEAVSLLQRYPACDLRKLAKELPRNPHAEKIFKTASYSLSKFDTATPFEVALYLVASDWKQALATLKRQADRTSEWCDKFLEASG
jgi:hypothetical protein